MEELTAEQVEELINCVYKCKYIGKTKVTKLFNFSGDPYGYKVTIGLNNEDKPLELAFDGDAKEVLCLLEKKLRQSHLIDTSYSYGMKGESWEDIKELPKRF